MRCALTLALVVVAMLIAQAADAGGPWSVELRGGGAFATQDIEDTELGPGIAFEGTVAYSFMPHLGAYAGWDWIRFSADESFAGDDMDVEETGYCFGLRFAHPIGDSSLKYFVRAGGVYDHLEFEDDGGDIIADSEHGMGWEAGGGVIAPIGEHWSVVPGIRYRSLSRDVEIDDTTTTVDMSYVTIEVGFMRSF